MKRCYKIYRGDEVLGFAGLDDQWPGEPFEPAESFSATEELFAKEHEVAMQASEFDRVGQRDQADSLFLEADRLQDQILAPGVRFEAMQDMLASFDCISLWIFDGRVGWR
ncbi:hypothetical protein [Roseimaritima ulvae]|uniref:hypothetical protein n=1 Tax=Roseimaritima ulvae TaxID=980254 RepID=UPI0011CEC0D4|nr:hypothetical protein [Roseimaritima ulvae]